METIGAIFLVLVVVGLGLFIRKRIYSVNEPEVRLIGARVPFSDVQIGEFIKFDGLNSVYERVQETEGEIDTLVYEGVDGGTLTAYCEPNNSEIVTIVSGD